MKVLPFWQKVAFVSFMAGGCWFLYAYFFIVARDPFLSSLFLTLAGLTSMEVIVGLYIQLKGVNEGWALLALIWGIVGTMGTAIHGAYDLANAIHVPMMMNADLPNMVDPRGFLAFFATGAAVAKFSYLSWVGKKLDKNLALLGFLSAFLLIAIYLGRLILLNPAEPVLKYPVLIEGFLINPIWYLWLGAVWNRNKEK